MIKKKYLMLLTVPLITLTSCGGNYIKAGKYNVVSIDKEVSGVITKDMKMEYYELKNAFYSKIELAKDLEKLDSLKGYMISMNYSVNKDGQSYDANSYMVYKFTNCGLAQYPVIKIDNYMMPTIMSEPIKELYENKHYTKGYLCRYSPIYNDDGGKKVYFTFYLVNFEYDENGNIKGDIKTDPLQYVDYDITDEIKVTFQLQE